MATEHDRVEYFTPLRDHLVSVVGKRRLARVKAILEFGSGKAGFIDLYARPGQRAIGVDLQDYSDNYPESVEWIVSDGETIPLPDECVDLIVSHSVVEHLADVPRSFRELDRVLTYDGLAYITVSPLYYSPSGSHDRSRPDWEHLDPRAGDFYMTRSPMGRDSLGSGLNQYTLPQLLAEFGRLPWDFLSMRRRHVHQPIPSHLEADCDALDLVTREFRLVAQKMGHMPESRALASGRFP